MILDAISLREFRSNGPAVKAWADFLATDHGKELAKCLRGQHPTTLLASTLIDARSLRDSSITEGAAEGIAHNLLGKVEGYEMCLRVLTDMASVHSVPVEQAARQTERVAQATRSGR